LLIFVLFAVQGMSDNVNFSEYAGYHDWNRDQPLDTPALPQGAPHHSSLFGYPQYSNFDVSLSNEGFGLSDPGESSDIAGGLSDYLVHTTTPSDHTTDPNKRHMALMQTMLRFDQSTLPQGFNPTQWESQEPENRNRDFHLSLAPSTTQRSAPRKSGQSTVVKRQKKRKHTHATQIKIKIEEATGTRDPSKLFTSRYDNRQEIEDRFFAVLMRDDFFPDIVAGEAMLVGVLNDMGFCESTSLYSCKNMTQKGFQPTISTTG
jgi:hypothetical protein